MKRLILGALAAAALAAGAAPASASHIAARAQDERACTHQDNSPSCRTAGETPGRSTDGLQANHNETLILDA